MCHTSSCVWLLFLSSKDGIKLYLYKVIGRQISGRHDLVCRTELFEAYRACVRTLRHAQEWPALKDMLALNLREHVGSTLEHIFPKRVFLAQSIALRLGAILKRSGIIQDLCLMEVGRDTPMLLRHCLVAFVCRCRECSWLTSGCSVYNVV